jgi:hydrogenase maturation factor
VPTFGDPMLNPRHDSAILQFNGARLAFTTDSFVVHPLFFPGGDIGSLAVYGTVNDLAMSGARPLFLSAGFILEEGLPMETLWRVVRSMQQAARHADVQIVTGDTKVVDKGKGDGIFINTSGVGLIEHPCRIAPDRVQPGDVLLLNGDVGRHGIAVIAVREDVQGACEMRGLDPLYVANEGRFVAFVAPHDAERALGVMRSHPLGRGACLVGRVTDATPAPVSMQSRIGARRIVDMLSGEQLPRIC